MKPRLSILVLTVLVSLLLAGSALAWDEAKLKAQVQGLLDQIAADLMKKDLKAVLAASQPGATITYQDGRTLDMAQWGAGAEKQLADWRDMKSKFVVEKVWPKGKDQAGAVYSERHEYTLASDPGHKHTISGRFRVILAKTKSGWRFLEFKELSLVLTRDGKPVRLKAVQK